SATSRQAASKRASNDAGALTGWSGATTAERDASVAWAGTPAEGGSALAATVAAPRSCVPASRAAPVKASPPAPVTAGGQQAVTSTRVEAAGRAETPRRVLTPARLPARRRPPRAARRRAPPPARPRVS